MADHVWSPRGTSPAFSLTNPNRFSSVWIRGRSGGALHRVTDEYFDSAEPAWDPEGNHREKVTAMRGGKVGYLHIPDMGPAGIAEFIKWHYAQVRKQGPIVDVPANGGGNVSQQIVDRLARTWLATTSSSRRDDNGTDPGTVFIGHMACLLNEASASDGDIFPYMFRQAGSGRSSASARGAALSGSPAAARWSPAARCSCRSAGRARWAASGSARGTASTPTSSSRTTRRRWRPARPAARARRGRGDEGDRRQTRPAAASSRRPGEDEMRTLPGCAGTMSEALLTLTTGR